VNTKELFGVKEMLSDVDLDVELLILGHQVGPLLLQHGHLKEFQV
jgi:hypothetical protein